MTKGQRDEFHPNRQVSRDALGGDPYDAMRDASLQAGTWQDRPSPKWFQEANRERTRESIAKRKTENANWPGLPVQHGPARP